MIRSIKIKKKFLILVFCLGCHSMPKPVSLPFFNSPEFNPEWIPASSPQYSKIHSIPPFSFLNQNGERITEMSVKGKIYVADFFFTRCISICPKMTENMGKLQKAFQNDPQVLLLSHSVTPSWDSVQTLKRYALRKGIISGKWHLLTGNQDSIYKIAKKEYFAGDSVGYFGEQKDFLHTEHFILLDKKRRIRGIYNGTLSLEMERLIDDIRNLENNEE